MLPGLRRQRALETRPAGPATPEVAAGHTLLELLIVLGVLSLVACLTVPPLMALSARLRVEFAAHEVLSVLYQARATAIRHSARCGVKFWVDDQERVSYGIYRDGDGDGVLTEDIRAGVDPLIGPVKPLSHLGRRIGFGFPPLPDLRTPGVSRPLDRLDDPIRFNRSDIASFTPFGGATPGTVYLTDHRNHLAAVRVSNRAGRLMLAIRDPRTGRWR